MFIDFVEGCGDIVFGNLIIMLECEEFVVFFILLFKNVWEVLFIFVLIFEILLFDVLLGMEIYVWLFFSYYVSLLVFNKMLEVVGKDLVWIVEVDENLEDEDFIELVNVGVVLVIIIDDYKVDFWF